MFGTVMVSIAAIIGQLVNVWLNLKLRAALAESENRILEKVEEKYVSERTCEARMRLPVQTANQ